MFGDKRWDTWGHDGRYNGEIIGFYGINYSDLTSATSK